MLNWIVANIGSIIVALVLVLIVTAIIVKMIRDKKRGKSSCGCGCAGCAFSKSCHNAAGKTDSADPSKK